jgi:hypothetical protein
MRNVRSRRSMVASRRRTTWATFDDAVSVATGGTHYQTNNMLTNYAGAGGTLAGITILRTHFRMTMTTAATAADRFYLGIVRGQNEDVGADIAGAPRPLNDFYEDWAFWSCYTSATLSGAGPGWSTNANNVVQLDLKARRKIPELQMTWNYVIQPAVATVTPALFRVSGRVLIGLP